MYVINKVMLKLLKKSYHTAITKTNNYAVAINLRTWKIHKPKPTYLIFSPLVKSINQKINDVAHSLFILFLCRNITISSELQNNSK